MAEVILLHSTHQSALDSEYRKILSKHGFEEENFSPDLFVLMREDEKKSIGIEEAKKLTAFFKERPLIAKLKAAVIPQAGLLTTQAQNSLLKTLEEPPRDSLVILCTTDLSLLLETVISRCKVIKVKTAHASKDENRFNLWSMDQKDKMLLAEELSKKERLEILSELENYIKFDTEYVSEHPESFLVVEKMLTIYDDIKKSTVSARFALEYAFLMHNAII